MTKSLNAQSDAEKLRLQLLSRAMFRDCEAYSYQRRTGLLDESEWKAMKETWRDILGSRMVLEVWEQSKLQYSHIPHDDLKNILENMPSRD